MEILLFFFFLLLLPLDSIVCLLEVITSFLFLDRFPSRNLSSLATLVAACYQVHVIETTKVNYEEEYTQRT